MSKPAKPVATLFPPGHFYSPIVDPEVIEARRTEIWDERTSVQGIDFDHQGHIRILANVFPKFIRDFDFPLALEEAMDANGRQRFHQLNDQFSHVDSRALFVFLREFRPRRVVEVGSGFSSLLMAETRARFLDPDMQIQCIEPYPRAFLRDPGYGLELIESKVEHIPLDFFQSLQAGDFLFIDSSHVSKTGSDVNYLVFEVLPRLAPGVLVHVHDIFLPRDYPYEWVVKDNRSWNEQYLLQAYLMFNPKAKIIFGSAYSYYALQPETAAAVGPGVITFGGSLWFRTG